MKVEVMLSNGVTLIDEYEKLVFFNGSDIDKIVPAKGGRSEKIPGGPSGNTTLVLKSGMVAINTLHVIKCKFLDAEPEAAPKESPKPKKKVEAEPDIDDAAAVIADAVTGAIHGLIDSLSDLKW